MKVKNSAYYVFTNKLYYAWYAYVLNPFWGGRRAHRERRRRANLGRIRRICNSFISVLDNVPDNHPVADKNEKIFTIWQQGEKNAPPLIQACFRSIRKNCKQELVVLDDDNIFDYITLPDVIVQKYRAGKIGRAHFADICRVELLYEHGGIWLDATAFATAPVPQWILDQDFFVYGANYVGIQNCFIRAKRGAYLLAAWRDLMLAYWENYNVLYSYWTHQIMFSVMVDTDVRAKQCFAKMPSLPDTLIRRLWYENADKTFNPELFDSCTADAFFQKTTYKSVCATNPVPGTVADVMINQMYKE